METAGAQGVIQMGSRQGSISLGYDQDQTRLFSAGFPDRVFGQTRFSEALEFRGDLNIVDARFMQIQYGTTFSWTQDNSSVLTQRIGTEPIVLLGDGKRPGSGRVLGYALSGNILPGKKYSFSAFSNRNHSINLREFAGSSEILSANRGVTVALRPQFLPSTVTHRQENLQEDALFGDLVGRRAESRIIDSYEGSKRWNSHDLGLRFEHSRIQDQLQPLLSYTSDNALLSHRVLFREELPKTLHSRLQYNHRRGQMGLSSLFLTEEYEIQHKKSLYSNYTYALSQFATDRSEATSHSIAAALQHTLFESLSTGASVQALRTTSSKSSQQQSYKTGLTARYRKKLPRSGMLMGTMSGTIQILDDQFQGTEIPVFQESHTARIGIPFLLSQPMVIPASIRVRGESGATLFQEGLDYVVSTHGDFSEISILFSGRIQEGDTLLIDYSVSAGSSRKNASWAQGYGIGTDFGWIYSHYDYTRTARSVLSGIREGIPEDLRAHSAGIDVRWQKGSFRGSFSNDFHTQDSALIPLDSLQFGQFLSIDVGRSFVLGLALDELLTHYKNPERRTQSGSGRLNAGWTPWPALSADGFIALRLWRDSIAEGETFQSAGLRVVWSSGLLQVHASYNLNLRRRNGDRSQESGINLRIVRRF